MVKKSLISALTCGVALLFVFTPQAHLAEEAKETPPPGSITFVGKNTIATANGTFKKWKITESIFDINDLAHSGVTIVVDVASIDTKIKKRDDHLRNADFFDVEQYPTATLKVHSITAGQGANSYIAKLDFEMHGVKKTYANFAFRTTSGDTVTVNGKFKINRMDFNIGEPKSPNPMSVEESIPIVFSATLP